MPLSARGAPTNGRSLPGRQVARPRVLIAMGQFSVVATKPCLERSTPPVAIVHDYLTQRGGAERVALALHNVFPEASLLTSVYNPKGTFLEFADREVRTSPINRVGLFRSHHRLALPLLAPAMSNIVVDAEVAICSSSGWAHGVRTTGRKIVYCHAPARWLYQADKYLDGRKLGPAMLSLRLLRHPLSEWDRSAAHSADRYLTNSSAMKDLIWKVYGISAEVIPPPPGLSHEGERIAIEGMEPGFFLCVSRLMPYKNVGVVAEAVERIGTARLVVVGQGPQLAHLRSSGLKSTTFLGGVGDAQLRWLYENCAAVVSASYEDYGLTPLEGYMFGKPAVALAAGGFLDTVADQCTGILFGSPTVQDVHEALGEFNNRPWNQEEIQAYGSRFSPESFGTRIRQIVNQEAVSQRNDLQRKHAEGCRDSAFSQ